MKSDDKMLTGKREQRERQRNTFNVRMIYIHSHKKRKHNTIILYFFSKKTSACTIIFDFTKVFKLPPIKRVFQFHVFAKNFVRGKGLMEKSPEEHPFGRIPFKSSREITADTSDTQNHILVLDCKVVYAGSAPNFKHLIIWTKQCIEVFVKFFFGHLSRGEKEDVFVEEKKT